MSGRILRTEPLTTYAFSRYGHVISGDRTDVTAKPANFGTAQRLNWLAPLDNLRPAARMNLCLFRCSPRSSWPLRVEVLERHPFTTQLVLPMNVERYVVVASERTHGDVPDLSKLRAFLVTGRQGVTYLPGTWHHPIIALDCESDFVSTVWEDGSEGDCTVVTLAEAERPAIELVG